MIYCKHQVSICLALVIFNAAYAAAQAQPAESQAPAKTEVLDENDLTSKLLEEAQEINTFIYKAGKLALEKSNSEDIKAFANELLRDHALGYRGAGMDQTVALQPKEAISAKQQVTLQQLQNAGREFDRIFVDQMVVTLRDALANSKEYASFGTNDLLSRSISSSIAKDEVNLASAERLQATLRGSNSK